jgi:hypothetical protein
MNTTIDALVAQLRIQELIEARRLLQSARGHEWSVDPAPRKEPPMRRLSRS